METNPNAIDRNGFESAMMFKNSILLNRIFNVFDTDKDGFINFSEFVNCLSTMSSKASQEEKLRCELSSANINLWQIP